MNCKSQKGITMLSLVIYVACFVIIASIIGAITAFFYNNTELLSSEAYSATEYNKLNIYLVNESEEVGNSFVDFDNTGSLYKLTFSNGNVYTFDTENNLLYFNKICLCEDVQDLQVTTDYTTGKEVIKVKINFSNKSYTTSYTMNNI